MKVVGFVGSPRKKGNTDLLVQQVLRGASEAGAETRVFYLNELNFKGCQGCFSCKVNDRCRLQDDMTTLYDEIASADGIVIGSPVYMWNITGQTKLFLDRFYAFLNPDYSCRLKGGKKAALVFSQGNPDAGLFKHCFESMAGLLNAAGMELQSTLVASGVLEPGVVAGNEVLMEKALALGKQLVFRS